jgi:hypothetical protein
LAVVAVVDGLLATLDGRAMREKSVHLVRKKAASINATGRSPIQIVASVKAVSFSRTCASRRRIVISLQVPFASDVCAR